MTKPPSLLRKYGSLALKIVVAVGALTYLSRSKALNFGALSVLIERPSLLAAGLGLWLVAGVLLAALRWRLLLALADVHPPYLRLVRLQLIALFFNVVVPGNVGGDVMKGYYVARDEPAEKKPAVLLIILVDRIMGLAGLIGVATISVLLNWSRLVSNPNTKPIIYSVLLLALGTFGGPVALYLLMKLARKPLDRFAAGTSKLASITKRLMHSVTLVASRPSLLLPSILVSMTIHGMSMSYFAMLTHAIVGGHTDVGAVASVFPIGMLSLVLPISPGGVGVGHVAFERLYQMIGIEGGATVFNVYLVAQIVPSAIGVIPYLMLKRSGDIPPPDANSPTASTPAPAEEG